MALFRRKEQGLSPEFQEYYQSTDQRSGIAWVLAILTLVVGVLLVVGLFLGGRWGYRRIANRDNQAASNQNLTDQDADKIIGNNQTGESSQPTTTPGQPATSPGQPAATTPQQNPNPAQPNTTTAGQTAQRTNPTPTPAAPPPASIPNTGPESDL